MNLSNIKKKLSIEFVLANAENATSGVGLSATHAKLLFDAGVNCISLGDHAFDQNEMINFAERDNRIIRPSAEYIGVESSDWVEIADRS